METQVAEIAFWVFGYGSLMWEPGFRPVERQRARLEGWHRCFCMRSIHHRGTVEAPGLVLALDRQEGAVCDGVALAVAAEEAQEVLAMLRERELVSSAYLETSQPVTLEDGRRVEALTYVIDPDHVQYCANLPLEDQALIIAVAAGGRGPNSDYLHNTVGHLEALGFEDADLMWLAARVRGLTPVS
ncbi:gamma-glutamylcyclotransferase [Haematobacter massiliensis]|uniref:gamma-glutamylcyclotransferase n=1 Tax=Haematobacter massiliensis TaxID=195105 RepID=UPI00055559B4|nr:gamma-glutamylcyclotransferase [Haematobacter massiliensis]OWJ70607.1 gamma-glutamylcyclotransferase [Haematobacter massiliensis]OWJ87533.1 gamma-glutamylcyclotransferase [Haematobacter massiliensis]QBJ25383.1 gamma-glutamylcyclotransferase [Haematobacter massiliensis]